MHCTLVLERKETNLSKDSWITAMSSMGYLMRVGLVLKCPRLLKRIIPALKLVLTTVLHQLSKTFCDSQLGIITTLGQRSITNSIPVAR